MNVYDFDNTIFRGDSTARFFAYCLLRRPRVWADLPGQAFNALLFVLRLRPKQAFKQRMFAFLTRIGDVDAALDAQAVKYAFAEGEREAVRRHMLALLEVDLPAAA